MTGMTCWYGMVEKQGHVKNFMKTKCLRDIKQHSFPYKCVDIWNGLKEITEAKSIHKFDLNLIIREMEAVPVYYN